MNAAEGFRYHMQKGTLTAVGKVKELLSLPDLDPVIRDDAEHYLQRVAVPIWE